jgi:signal transduction histidine kinase
MSRSVNPSSRGDPHICAPERESWPNARSTGDSTDGRAVLADAHPATIAAARQQPDLLGGVWRPERITRDGLIEALTALSHRCRALTARNRELASEVNQLRAERRRLERDLHDGVQNELVALIIKLSLAEQDPDTPPPFTALLSALGARAEQVLDSVRQIARGSYPPLLADFGLREALRAQATRASIDVKLEGTAPRRSDEAEAGVYFSCLEAIQNVAKHAGRNAHATLGLHRQHGTLAVRIEDDGCGFDPAHTPDGTGLENIRARIQTLDGAVKLTSSAGRGTVMTISLPWPARPPTTAPPNLRVQQSRGLR